MTFLLGAVIGSIITYRIFTREKRAVSNVRGDLERLAMYHELTKGQYARLLDSQLVTDQKILSMYDWGRDVIKRVSRQQRRRLSPIAIACEAIICEKLLGRPWSDGVQALLASKTVDDLQRYWQAKKLAQVTDGPPSNNRPAPTLQELISGDGRRPPV
jgi:hypothetical protein